MSERDLFWFVAGLLVAGSATVMWMRLWPEQSGSWHRIFRQYGMWGITVATAIGALLLYRLLGNPAVLTATGAAATRSAADAAGSMQSVLAGLEQRLAAQGGSEADWQLLAQTYSVLGREAAAEQARQHHLPDQSSTADAGALTTKEAVAQSVPLERSAVGAQLLAKADQLRRARDFSGARDAYVALVRRNEMDADSWADYADVEASLRGGSLVGEPESFLQRALQLDAHHAKALWLMASLRHEQQRYAEAVMLWRQLAAVIGSDSSDARIVAANLAEDQQRVAQLPAGKTVAAPAGATGASIDGEVLVADALKARVASGLTLFIYARSVDSPGAPVAIVRSSTGSWPVHFHLDDSLAMIPGRNLSTAGLVVIEARVSRSGQAQVQPGDLTGSTSTLRPGSAGPVRVVIDQVQGG